ncbi:uncharacterized protein LOC129974476 [Argiope bruennichi]|uniref:uncharacterized protein LOC129974476 n=1 Tax=Argiope bruennichi TaxID=94029 RepID=UPI0024952CDF|nr:uncharacterized protein LOC129974476 [Argiope bruennichi]
MEESNRNSMAFPNIPWPRPINVQSFFSSLNNPLNSSREQNPVNEERNPFCAPSRVLQIANFVSECLEQHSSSNNQNESDMPTKKQNEGDLSTKKKNEDDLSAKKENEGDPSVKKQNEGDRSTKKQCEDDLSVKKENEGDPSVKKENEDDLPAKKQDEVGSLPTSNPEASCSTDLGKKTENTSKKRRKGKRRHKKNNNRLGNSSICDQNEKAVLQSKI